ncbi:TPA: DUF1983 domain-containing protein [Klebsiella pneumoniae]|nr:DUF1983 domain-containing protein [Klebsiella pneumoniae]HBW6807570.1 DUF1983 domain-containing protein [Klebsiella pneumoniae]
MGDNLIQDANLEGDGSAFRTQQNSGTTGSIVAFGAYGENSAGARMLKVNATSPGLFANGKKPTPVNGSRKFRYIVRAKGVSGSMNMLLRRWNFNGSAEGNYEDKNVTLTSDWQTITWDTSFSPSTGADGQAFGIYCHPSNAEIWIDSFQVFDITDAVNNDATASALSDLSTKVTKQGDTVSSQGTSITKLQNDLTSTKTDVSKKADSTALQTLQNTVSDQGKTLTSQGNAITALTGTVDTVKGDVAKKADATALNNLSTRVSNAEDKISSSSDAITSLNSSLNQQSKRGANILPDGTFESYSSGYNITNGRVIVTTEDSHGGNKCIRVTRPNDYNANATDNSDNHIFSGFQVRDNAVFYMECWVKLDANSTAMAENVQISVGLSLQYQDNSWQWPAVTKAAKDLSSTQWTKISGYLKSTKSGIKQAMVRISIPNVSSVKAGNSFLIDDLVITDVTDAYNAQQTADATASAVSTLQTTVSNQGDSITSQGDSITTLNNGLATANKAIGTKADASALSSLQNTVTQQGEDVAANTNNITALSNQVVNGKQATWARRIYKCQLANAGTEPTFSDIQGLSPVFMDEVADAAKMDFSGAGSYVVAHYKAMVRVAADTTITMAPGSRVFDDTGAVYVNGVRVAFGNAGWNTVSFDLKAGWNTVEFLVNQWTGNAYVNLGFKLGDKVAELYSGLGVSSLSSALNSINSNVSKVGDQVSSNSTAITSLKNGLSDTNSTVAKKADATALQTLQNTVTQQGKDIASQSGNVTNLQNSLSATNTGLANLVADSDASKKIIGNLLTNSSFERGLEGFSGGASFIKVIDAQSPNSGSKILSCGAGTGTVSQSIAVTKDRTYKIGVFARCQSGTVVDNQSNNKLRIGNSSPLIDFQFKPTDLPTDSTWKEISGTWKATISDRVGISINSSLKSGNQYFDDFYFIDITDIVNIDAASNAVASLTSRVTSAEGTVSSHTGSITNLSNSLNSLNNTVSGKADASALQSLQNTVTQQGKDLSSASDSVTDLKSSLNTLKVQSNPWIDGTFETYDNNQQLGGSTAIVTTDFKSSGSKCLKVTRPANTSGNSDKMIGSYSAVRQSAKYRVEFWAMMPASEAPPSGWTVVVGLHSINKDGGNDWQGITFNEAGLGGRDQWVKFSGVVKVSPSVTRSHVWISTRGQSGSNTPGYAVYIDDFVITDITDAADAQATADANATAISSLQTKVSDIDGKVTAQTSQLSSMQSKVDASSSKVDQLSKTISDSQSTQASLNTSLQSQIDAQASANIKNQADLNSATTSIASIKSTQATQATQISAMAKTQTDMTASLNSQSASIQTLQEAVSNNDALNSTWMVKMETNNNGQKYAAGIALGVDGKNMQSQFLVQADRFALINTSNGNTTTPFVIDNGVTYMNAAFIKDGSIGSAKVGDLMSSNFQENVRGWRISRDGTMNINGSGPGSSRTVITNGRIEVYDSNNRLRVRMGIF